MCVCVQMYKPQHACGGHVSALRSLFPSCDRKGIKLSGFSLTNHLTGLCPKCFTGKANACVFYIHRGKYVITEIVKIFF